jgi:hypothetical protein
MHRILLARRSAIGTALTVLLGVGFFGSSITETRRQFNPLDVRANASALAGIGFDSPVTDSVDVLGDTTRQAMAEVSSGDTDASTVAWVDDGVIRLQIGTMGPGSPITLGTGGFGDAFLVTSTTNLPAGSPVEFRVELGFSRTLNIAPGEECSFSGAQADAQLHSDTVLVRATDNTCPLRDDLPASFEVIIQKQVGERFALVLFAQLGGASSPNTGAGVSGSVSVRMHVTPLGAADYLTASGNDYRRMDAEEPTLEELLEDLVQAVASLNLQAGISNALDAKLDAARNALDDVNENNDVAAINSLQALINHIEAQRGNKLTDEQADMLIAATLAIIEAIQSGGG